MTLGVLINKVGRRCLLALTIAYYVFFYTMWLKRRRRRTSSSAARPVRSLLMIGWAAVTGTVSIESVLMFLIIFLWTPPHFWALALYRCRDYERVGVPMLPVVAGPDETRRRILPGLAGADAAGGLHPSSASAGSSIGDVGGARSRVPLPRLEGLAGARGARGGSRGQAALHVLDLLPVPCCSP